MRDKKRLVPCAAYCDKDYGVGGYFVGVPVVLGTGGVEKIIELKLLPDERTALDKSIGAVKELVGVMDRLAGELPVGLAVTELSDEKKTFGRMVEVATALRDVHGANVIVMGCAGMARYRKPLQDAVGLPVVEPSQAAVGLAIARVRLGWSA